MTWDVETLSRIQFAFTIMFHYIFPPFSIGLGLLLVIYESLYIITKKKIYEKITRFWIKIFAANFSVGVASGIVMEFEFGTNWSTYSRFVGDIFGSPLAAEGIFAFFSGIWLLGHSIVWLESGQAGHAPLCYYHGGFGQYPFRILDSRSQ